MAPMTRSTQPSAGIAKKVHRKQATSRKPSDSWDLMAAQERNSKAISVPMDDSEDDMTDPLDSPNVVDSVEQLREVSDRVENKVEEFAITLDRFLEELPTAASRYDAVRSLVAEFRSIAEEAVERMQKTHGYELRDYMKREWLEQARISTSSTQRANGLGVSSALSTRRAEQVKELRRWQQEADIWDLFGIMLDQHPFESDARALRLERDQRLEELGPVHRYTSENELWERFMLQDDSAREQQAIKEWLERTVQHQQSDLQGVQEILEAKSGRGKGMWSSGWMDTREKIKAEKLRRNWPVDEMPPLPDIRRSDNRELLVTKLDPDAPTRQQRTLEGPDINFERAMWIACWEMLRHGADWDEVAQWCEERKANWRAVCLGGFVDSGDPARSSAAWRRACDVASRALSPNEHEAAVFGLLGGNMNAVEKVCRSMDDHLFAFYSTNLVKQFEEYIAQRCPDKALPSGFGRRSADIQPGDLAQTELPVGELIQRLRNAPATKNESAQPMKIIQSYLVADEVGSLVHTIGAAVGKASRLHGTDDILFLTNDNVPTNTLSLPEMEVALDPQTLRIVAHMSILYGILSPYHLEDNELYEDENVLVSYVQLLRAEGKRDSIPTYASRLQSERCISVLSQSLEDITETREQREYLEFIQDANIDRIAIITEHLTRVMDRSLIDQPRLPALRILEPTEDTRLYPGQMICKGFIPEHVNKDDMAIVRSLSWFQLAQGGWKVTFDALSLALRKCLVYGRFACARAIVDNYPFDQISFSKSYHAIGKSVNPFDFTAESAPHDEEERMTLELLRRQSRTYYELCELVIAIEHLSAWRAVEEEYTSIVPKPHHIPSTLRNHLEDVIASMAPVVKGILLQSADEAEAEDLNYIRFNYVPELIIAYISVLQTAGSIISRDCLLDAMDLANDVANGKGNGSESNGLQECFVQAGRIKELVECFALVSKAMLVLKAEGREWKSGRNKLGRDLGMWEIGGGGLHGSVADEE